MPLRPDRALELVSASDVARVVAEEISRVSPKKVDYKQISVADAGKGMSGDVGIMFQWMDEHGFNGDLLLAKTLLKRFEKPLTSFREFLGRSRDMFRKAA